MVLVLGNKIHKLISVGDIGKMSLSFLGLKNLES